ncbi:hypothetical protein VTN49DRAFT_3 [Thermomyces lanuginosus]|uniref:uncharacterized protein n=1 Tax=Thermomyces lanuginosus TaxID=5541 RepID=UPI00374376AE
MNEQLVMKQRTSLDYDCLRCFDDDHDTNELDERYFDLTSRDMDDTLSYFLFFSSFYSLPLSFLSDFRSIPCTSAKRYLTFLLFFFFPPVFSSPP